MAAVQWGPVRGQVVFDSTQHPGCQELESSGFSWTGTRSLLLTDQPAVYVHDTGGFGGFGTPVVAALDPATDPEATVELTDKSTTLVVDVRLPPNRSLRFRCGPLPAPAIAALTGLRGRLVRDAGTMDFISPCAVSVTPWYEDETPPEELVAYVMVGGGRLRLRSRGTTLLEWPVNRIAATPSGASAVELRGGALFNGRFLAGATLHLGTFQVQRALLAVLKAAGGPGPAEVGTSAPVTIRGLGGDPASVAADCVLNEAALEFQSSDTQRVLARFDLDDPHLRIAGSARRFVVFTPAHGPLTVVCASEAFGQRLHRNAKVRAAAERTLTSGVLPAELADGRPVACAFAPDGMRVKGAGVNLRVPYRSITEVAGEPAEPQSRLRLRAGNDELVIVSRPELIQALHTELRAWANACVDPRQLPGMLRATVGLEEDYLLYTVFGPFYELHAALLGDADAALGTPVELPESGEERGRIAAVLQVGLGELLRHLDQVGYVLPAFIRHRDAQLLAPVIGGKAEPGWLKTGEAKLRGAFAPVQRVAGEVGQLAAQVARLIDLDPDALPKPSYAGAVVSLGAAALVNPVFAVSGLSQAYSARSQGQARKAQVTAQSERGWTLVLERWNALVSTSLPVLAYVLTENVFPHRWEMARHLGKEIRDAPPKARLPLLRAVARRLAVLDVARRYPSDPGIRLRRGEIADYLRTARDAIGTPRFLEF